MMWKTLWNDWPLRLFLAVSLAAVVLDVWVVGSHVGATSMVILSGLILLAIGMTGLGLGDLTGRRERRFWTLIVGALGLWLVEHLLVLALPVDVWRRSFAPELLANALYTGFYLCFLFAAEARPHMPPNYLPDRRLRRLEVAGILVLVSGLFVYFILLPGLLAKNAYGLWLPSYYLYFTFDVVLVLRFARLSAIADGARWRWLYGILSFVFFLLATIDVLDGLEYSEKVQWPWISVVDSFTPLALLGIVAAARWSRLETQDKAPQLGLYWTPPPTIGSPLVLAAFTFPVAHFGFYGLGLLVDATRGPHQLVVFFAMILLGGMAFIEHGLLLERSAHLEKEYREARRSSAERTTYLNALIEHSPLAIVVLDPNHRVRISNPAFEALFGYTSAEVEGVDLDDLIAPGGNEKEALGFTHKVLEGDAVHQTARRLRKDGSLVEVELHGVPLHVDGELIGIFALYQDISARRAAERSLKDSEERFRLLSEATFEGLVITDSGKIVDTNEQYARMLAYPREKLLGKEVEDFVAPQDRDLVRRNIERRYKRPFEHRAIRSDGSIFVVEVHARSIPYQDRTMRVAAVRDITERRRLEEDIRQAQKMEAVGRLAGGIAHDFNNILTVISGYSQLLAFQLDSSPLISQVEEIRQAADHATLITQRLLAFSRKRSIHPVILDLNEALGGMEKMLRRLLPADITLELELSPGAVPIRADHGQIEQLILNLTINAADAMPQGGVLRLGTSEVEFRESVAPRSAQVISGRYVLLMVEDTGMGMDDSTKAQAFDPFFTTKEPGKGTGLGLSTVYGIVQQSGGGILVDSEVDRGTCFQIYLPWAEDASSQATDVAEPAPAPRPVILGQSTVPPESVPPKTLSPDPPDTPGEDAAEDPGSREAFRGTLLVVEDEEAVRQVAIQFLELEGFEVLEAIDGNHALKILEDFDGPIDLILTDMVMPGLSGPEMVERALKRRPGTHVVYMSGYADEVLRERSFAGATAILQKPFSREGLLQRIEGALAGEGV